MSHQSITHFILVSFLLLFSTLSFAQSPDNTVLKIAPLPEPIHYNIEDSTLALFVSILPQIEQLGREEDAQIEKIVTSKGLTMQRYTALKIADSQRRSIENTTEAEKIAFEQADTAIRTLQAHYQEEVMKLLPQNLSQEKFIEIVKSMKNDPEVHRKIHLLKNQAN